MNWDDSAYLVSKNRYSENSIIAEVFTENHGKISGIIFGGTSKKIKNYLQIGNKIYVNYNSKSVTRIGYFKIEILKALTPLYFDENQKLSCITSAMHLIKLLTAEAQSNKEIFKVLPIYKLISNTGPRHKPLFKVAVKLENTKFFTAEGSSKKDAEQNAASLCIEDVFKKWIGMIALI